jgi:hypothetical protein
MNDLFVSLDEIKSELKEIELLGTDLCRKVLLLGQKIGYILSKIKACETEEAAEYYFSLLDELHETLAVLVFKDEIMIPEILRNFVSHFDNLEGNKKYLFREIKNGHYNWRG